MALKVGEYLMVLLEKKLDTDVTFKVEGKGIQCHSLILKARNCELSRLVEGNARHFEIEDIAFDIFWELIR